MLDKREILWGDTQETTRWLIWGRERALALKGAMDVHVLQLSGMGRKEKPCYSSGNPRIQGVLNVWEVQASTPASCPPEPIRRGCYVYPEHFQGMFLHPPWKRTQSPSIQLSCCLSQGGRTVEEVSSSVNEGSEEKLFITEAEARCASWGFLPVPCVPGCPTRLSEPNNASMET